MKAAVYGRPIALQGFESFFKQFSECLDRHGIRFELIGTYASFVAEHYGLKVASCASEDLLTDGFDFLISLGGDGTVLDTLALVKDSGLPVLGVNLGRFGFLANLQIEDLDDAVQKLIGGHYEIEGRAVIEVETDIPEMQEFPYALNDFVVQKRDSSSMITVDAYLGGDFLNTYWSDGLIVATPTGSSGYSLSCGGPLIFPGTQAFVITPIAAHHLTVRPALFPNDKSFRFEISSRGANVLASLDSRSFKVPSSTKFKVSKADFEFNMMRLQGMSYMDTIRTKLMWGADRRNK